VGTLFGDALFDHLLAQFVIERQQLGHEAALQTRTHPLVEALDVVRRAGRRDHHLLAAIQQRIDDVIELLLGAFALEEFEIVDQQQRDVAEALLEGRGSTSAALRRN
jgi:hypothetical protein